MKLGVVFQDFAGPVVGTLEIFLVRGAELFDGLFPGGTSGHFLHVAVAVYEGEVEVHHEEGGCAGFLHVAEDVVHHSIVFAERWRGVLAELPAFVGVDRLAALASGGVVVDVDIYH